MIYVDNAATTRVCDASREALLWAIDHYYGNPSSQHSFGANTKRLIAASRNLIADALGASANQIYFTSGATEANNWALAQVTSDSAPSHIITTAIEHDSILQGCHELEKRGIAVTYVRPDPLGRINPDAIKDAIRPNTRLISVMLANNETGVTQPVSEIARIAHQRNIAVHTDAVQAVGHIPVDVRALDVDFLSLSGHKFHAPKGIGALWTRSKALRPWQFGGGQESGARAGTENVPGILAMAAAVRDFKCTNMHAVYVEALRSQLWNELTNRVPGIRLNGHKVHRLPGILNVEVPHIQGEAMVHILDGRQICVSTGSACTSGVDHASHVLLAMGRTESEARRSIRLSLSQYNTPEEMMEIAVAIASIAERSAKALSLGSIDA